MNPVPATELSTDPDQLLAELLFDPADPTDPHPRFARLREVAPWFDAAVGCVVVSTYSGCIEVLRHPDLGRPPPGLLSPITDSTGGGTLANAKTFQTKSMLFVNPPDHTRMRGLLMRSFTQRRMNDYAPRIAELADDYLDRVVSGNEIDFMEEVAWPYPMAVIADIMGVPADRWDDLRNWMASVGHMVQMAPSPDELIEADRAIGAIVDYLSDLLDERRRAPTGDVLSLMLAARDEHRMDDEELVYTALTLFGAGFETTARQIGNAVYRLLRHPDQLARLREDRSLMPNAVNELLRFEPTTMLDGRYAEEDVVMDGGSVGAGKIVLCMLAAANRDPQRYDDPDTLDLTRPDPAPMTFGYGLHHCLGTVLARIELGVLFERMLDRFERWELVAEPAWNRSLILRGVEDLNVRFA